MLEGLTVLDFTRVLAGPYCTRLLADLGARILKVERPELGDDTRAFYLQLEEGRTDQSSYFVRFNAGKESIAQLTGVDDIVVGEPGSGHHRCPCLPMSGPCAKFWNGPRHI